MRSYEEIKELWSDFKEDIKFNNRYFVGSEILDILNRFYDNAKNKRGKMVGYYPATDGPFYRARIGNFEKSEDEKMLAPPEGSASAGRCNPEGISYLYLADDEYTAISEVKPNKGDIVTVAEIEMKEISLFDLALYASDDENLKNFLGLEDKELQSLVKIINEDFKSVVTVENKISYLPYQFITEYIKSKKENDGFTYKSILGIGNNYVIFNCDNRITVKNKYIVNIEDVSYKIQK